ncbi:hypothetical protein CSKR_110496 [Clonorchis sinensis]|uniref:Uncharacterized protein n=1 Tax=Clonorchis sinensis TaxID=79923 RepID=A0A419PEE7_CLOSI|nr:hypothetical protein CSKR_110496 [Clonorchis sinensis]
MCCTRPPHVPVATIFEIYLEYRSNWNMRRPGTAHSVARKHHKREIQLVFRTLHPGWCQAASRHQLMLAGSATFESGVLLAKQPKFFQSRVCQFIFSQLIIVFALRVQFTCRPATEEFQNKPTDLRLKVNAIIWMLGKTGMLIVLEDQVGLLLIPAARWLKWLESEFTDRKVRGSNPTSASRLPLGYDTAKCCQSAIVSRCWESRLAHQAQIVRHIGSGQYDDGKNEHSSPCTTHKSIVSRQRAQNGEQTQVTHCDLKKSQSSTSLDRLRKANPSIRNDHRLMN